MLSVQPRADIGEFQPDLRVNVSKSALPERVHSMLQLAKQGNAPIGFRWFSDGGVMELEYEQKIIAVPVTMALFGIAGWYLASETGGCPKDNKAAVEQYQNNKPSISNQFFIDDNREAIANLLVPLWFSLFTSRIADPGNRLEEYEIDKMTVGPWKDDKFPASVAFSVKPFKCSYEEWLTGNGDEAGAWIRDKFLFFGIAKAGDKYKVESVGSGP